MGTCAGKGSGPAGGFKHSRKVQGVRGLGPGNKQGRDRGDVGGRARSLFGKLIYRSLLSERLPPPGGSYGRHLEGGDQVTKCL